jgi:hypothetical protein
MAIGGAVGALLGFLFHALCAAAGRPMPSPTSDAVKILDRVTGDDRALQVAVDALVTKARKQLERRKARKRAD